MNRLDGGKGEDCREGNGMYGRRTFQTERSGSKVSNVETQLVCKEDSVARPE